MLGDLGLYISNETVRGNAFLLHRIAVTDSHRAVGERIEIDGNAYRRADLVLAAVALPDVAVVIELASHMRFECVEDAARFLDELRLVLKKRKDRSLDRCERASGKA
jgi:hypothetical protein